MQTNQATPDELATLYLRGRDVPCPGCGYNRRDGVTMGCPECSHALALKPEAPYRLEIKPRFARFFLVSIMVFSASFLCYSAFLIVKNPSTAFPTRPTYWIWLMEIAFYSIARFSTVWFALSALREIRSKGGTSGRLFSLAILTFVAPAIWEIGQIINYLMG